MDGLEISKAQKAKIVGLLGDEGYCKYEFNNNDRMLIIDDVDTEEEGNELEGRIKDILA